MSKLRSLANKRDDRMAKIIVDERDLSIMLRQISGSVTGIQWVKQEPKRFIWATVNKELAELPYEYLE